MTLFEFLAQSMPLRTENKSWAQMGYDTDQKSKRLSLTVTADSQQFTESDFSQDIQFHNQLNPVLWQDHSMIPDVKSHLKEIAHAFLQFLDLPDLKITDLTISGSNAAYTYTKHSDVDLHLVVEVPKSKQELMRKYFDTKKNLFNEQHTISVNDQPVELYVQFSDQPHISAGIYSIMRDRWIQQPKHIRADIDHSDVQSKLIQHVDMIKKAIKQGNSSDVERAIKHIRELRKSGLETTGEWGTDNLVFKILRNRGILDQLSDLKIRLQDQELSLEEEQI